MRSCVECKYADWHRTANGRLHPDGEGRCTFEVKIPAIPASMSWGYSSTDKPHIGGGYINRKRELSKDCPCYQRTP